MKNKRYDMKSITVLMFVATFFLWVILLLVKWLVWGITVEELFNDFVSNMLGILPPIIIFNFLYEYLTKKHVADEMADEITKTLMSNPDAIKGFDQATKKRFIYTTIDTIVGNEYSDMVCNLLEPYITNQYDVRNFFKYTIYLREYKNHALFTSEHYFKIYENLKYKKTFHSEDDFSGQVTIGFFTQNTDLDKQLRNHNYLFRENISWRTEELEAFLAFSEEEREKFIKEEMALSLYIDNEKCTIRAIEVNRGGIFVDFLSTHMPAEDHAHSVEISFAMPQKRGRSQVQVSISEPTYSPVIQFSYPEDIMKVDAFSFMNDGDDTTIEAATRCIGGYEFCVQDKWIYPMSGVVFVIDDIG